MADGSQLLHRATWLDRAYPDDVPEFPDCTFQVDGADTPAMVADWWSFVLPRGTLEKARREAEATAHT